MARTSKTRLNKPGESSDRMMRANATGRQAVERQLDRDQADKRASQARGQQAQSQGLSALGQAEGRRQQADQFQSSQQESSRRFDAQQTDRAAGRAQQAEQFDRTAANNESRTDLQGAQAGFERGGGGGRAAQLEQEMQRGAEQTGGGPGAMDATGGRGPGQLSPDDQERLRGQTSKPLELDGKWRATDERKAEKAAESKLDNFKADTDRMKAETYRDQQGAAYQRAGMKGELEAQKEIAATLARPINGDVEKFDRMTNGEAKDSDWGDLKKLAGESHDIDPTLHADIAAKNYSPRVQQFQRAQISKESLKYIIRTGETGNLNIDWTAPAMRQFTDAVAQVNAQAKTLGPDFAKMAGIKSVKDKMAFVQTQAAMMVMSGMDQYQQPDPTGGMPPSMGQQPAPGAEQQGQGIDPNSLEAQDSTGTSDGVTSDAQTQEAIAMRERGEYVPPADSPASQRIGQPTPPTRKPLTGGYH